VRWSLNRPQLGWPVDARRRSQMILVHVEVSSVFAIGRTSSDERDDRSSRQLGPLVHHAWTTVTTVVSSSSWARLGIRDSRSAFPLLHSC